MPEGTKTIAVTAYLWIEVPDTLEDGDELDEAYKLGEAKLKTAGLIRDTDYRFGNAEDVS